MPRQVIFTRSRARYHTPPVELYHLGHGHAETPSRAAVLAIKAAAQKLQIQIPQSIITEVTGIPPRAQRTIKQPRRLHNQPDIHDPRGAKRAFWREDSATIGRYLDDLKVPLDEKGRPWQTIAIEAGVQLPETLHYRPPGTRLVNADTIQRTCKRDEGIINAICEEEKLLKPHQAASRLRWIKTQLELRPHSMDWKDVAFCDEFHFGIGPQETKRIKRRRGAAARHAPQNVNRKSVTKKDEKAKAREDEQLELFNIFVVISYNWRASIPYRVPNTIRKMKTKVYLNTVLPQLLPELQQRDLILCQDADSAHTSKATTRWTEQHGMKLLALPGVSPDMSILELLAHPVKKLFHEQYCSFQQAAYVRFIELWDEKVDQQQIQHMYDYYAKRLHDVRRANGQMSQY